MSKRFREKTSISSAHTLDRNISAIRTSSPWPISQRDYGLVHLPHLPRDLQWIEVRVVAVTVPSQ